jgi:flagellar biosynthesis/type III secretory pathway M-ring protein FliF/YscJ
MEVTVVEEPAPVLLPAAETHETQAALSGQAPAMQLPAASPEMVTSQMRESAAQDAEAWAQILRAWIAEEERA